MGTRASRVAAALAASGVRFLFDENFPPRFAEAFRLVGYNSAANEEVGLRSADDLEVIRYCGANGMVWVTKDIDARKRAAYAEEVRRLGVSAVHLVSPRAKGRTIKEQFELLARHMRWLEARYEERAPRYFHIRRRGEPREVGTFATRSPR